MHLAPPRSARPEYSVQPRGNTCCVTDHGALLPRRNLQVARPRYEQGETAAAAAIATTIRHQLSALDAELSGEDVALAMAWTGAPSDNRLLPFARPIRDGRADRIAANRPVHVMLDGDVAMTLGRLLRQELGVASELLVIDGLALRHFDYLDIARMRYPSNTVPVTITSLVFRDDPQPDAPAAPRLRRSPAPAAPAPVA